MLVLFCWFTYSQNRKPGHQLRVRRREAMLVRPEKRYEIVVYGSEGREGPGKCNMVIELH